MPGSRPSYKELLQILDEVSATAESLIAPSFFFMPAEGRDEKVKQIINARKLCDRALRSELRKIA